MSLNGNIKRIGAIGLLLGGVMAFSVFLIIYNLELPSNPNVPPQENLIGERIAARMAEAEENISHVWCYNNSFVNGNLSEYYEMYIDGLSIGKSLNDSLIMALIHEPLAESTEVSQSSLNSVMASFRSAVTNVAGYSSVSDLMEIWPPNFMIDIAYEDGTSLSLIFSKTHQVLSIHNGTWEFSPHYRYGIQLLDFTRESIGEVFLEITDTQYMLAAIQAFETWIHEIFPE
ncbi:MAG: hypothetical protein EAX86_12575 [Candidatus Heimdallarchaeota archaeon]|nr:hypothetical protein [Candidatus Heimdallarchaeota archaeon]